jgi:hypothetical protein
MLTPLVPWEVYDLKAGLYSLKEIWALREAAQADRNARRAQTQSSSLNHVSSCGLLCRDKS